MGAERARRPEREARRTRYVASEIPVEQRAPIIAAYRPLAGKVVEGYWKSCPPTPTTRSSR